MGKKAAILRGFADRLSLENVSVLAERVETLGRDAAHRERYDVVTARACAPLPVLVELALPLLPVGGQLLAWKGPLGEEDPEVRAGNAVSPLVGGAGRPARIDQGKRGQRIEQVQASDRVRLDHPCQIDPRVCLEQECDVPLEDVEEGLPGPEALQRQARGVRGIGG